MNNESGLDTNMQTLTEQFRLFRIAINAKFAMNAPLKGGRIMTVVSSFPDDGRSFIASGLAKSYAQSGMKAALIDQASTPSFDAVTENVNAFTLDSGVVKMRFPETDVDRSHDRSTFVNKLRQDFDVVIIAASIVHPSEETLAFIAASSGVVIAVQHGRKFVKQDAELIEMLRKLDVPILGTVPTGSEARAFTSSYSAAAVVPVVSGILPAPQPQSV